MLVANTIIFGLGSVSFYLKGRLSFRLEYIWVYIKVYTLNTYM